MMNDVHIYIYIEWYIHLHVFICIYVHLSINNIFIYIYVHLCENNIFVMFSAQVDRIQRTNDQLKASLEALLSAPKK